MNKHDPLLQSWYQSIISNNLLRMVESAGAEENYDGWINDKCWEIYFQLDQSISVDEGTYLDQPSSEVTSIIIVGEIWIYNADGEITSNINFEYQEFKNPKITVSW